MSRRLSRKEKAAIERAGLLHRLATENFYAMPLDRLRRVVAAIDEPALTDAEREALQRLCDAVVEYAADDRQTNGETFAAGDEHAVTVVRAFLARLGGAR